MSDVNLSIRFYEPGDEEGIVELLKKTFPKWASFSDPLSLWRWKYIDSPNNFLITLAVADDRIVGCEHVLIYRAKLGSEITGLGYFDDLAVDIEFRGLGISNKIRVKRFEKISTMAKYRYSTTMNPIVRKNWIKNNRNLLPFPVTRMMKTHDIDIQLRTRPMKNSFLVKTGHISLKALNRITNLFRTPIKTSNEFKITQINEFDEGIDSFWDKIKDDYNFILEKKHEYLNWRFTDNDRGNHIKFQAVDGEDVLGYAVVGFKEGSIEGQIEDLVALKGRVDVVDALFDSACKILDDLGVNTVYYQVVQGHPYHELSRRHGFIDTRSRPNISLDYSEYSIGKHEIPFLKHTSPNQVYFNYATTV